MIIFAGPTISAREAPGFEVRPPAAQGDIYLAARAHPAAIGLIDGYFDERPAVWHKEILWALAEGIPVYGAASMGALRAAELHVFGMRGVGRIFEAYRDGRLTADDAVALVHGPPDTGYAAMSEPLVNIEATLARAERDGIVSSAEAAFLGDLARQLHYRDRNWNRLLADARASRTESMLSALGAWVRSHRVDQKRLDALEMLEAMRLSAPAEPVAFRFEHTELWQELVEAAGSFAGLSRAERDALLDEVRLAPQAEVVRWRAMTRRFLRRAEMPHASNGKVVGELRLKLGLLRRRDFERWLDDNGLGEAEFGRLAAEEASLTNARDVRWVDSLVDELRLAGLFTPLLDRARRKQALLAERGMEEGDVGTPGGLATLVGWYCARRGTPTPDDIDTFRTTLGFGDIATLRRALGRERIYATLSVGDGERPVAAARAKGAPAD